MKIAIIGSGISGLTCAYHLSREHDVVVYEANDYMGGHTATVDVVVDDKPYAVDTGFIVYNDRTYPHFIQLLGEIGVESLPTQMSFSVRNDRANLEYNGHTLRTLFAQRKNLFRPQFYHFIGEILKFNRLAKRSFRDDLENTEQLTLGEFLATHGFSDYFNENYILPMGAAIWSSTIADMRAFPLAFFLRFFLNHGLLDITNRPQWYVIKGGSRSYIEPMIQSFKDKIYLNTPVLSVRRSATQVDVVTARETATYDEVIFACHSDQALQMLNEPTPQEREVLSALVYQTNQVTLHLDTSLLPHNKLAWASWNYWISHSDAKAEDRLSLTYNMNILQHIESPQTFCVSLNSDADIDPDKILRQFSYDHPVFNAQAMTAQRRKDEISGVNHTWFCGAYWYNGFHEDGVKSALDVVTGLKAVPPFSLSSQVSQGAA